MRLAENQLYLRFSSYDDVLNEGGHLRLVRSLEKLTGETFASFLDLVPPRAQAIDEPGRINALLQAHVGAGFHQSSRFRLSATGGALASLEINAGLHPYSGVYVTQVDARVDAEFAAGHADEIVELVEAWITDFHPLTLQAGDADDDAVQNIDMPRLAQRGYGYAAPADPAARPGREAVRGQFRIAPTWINYLGDELLKLLEPGDDLYRLPDTDIRTLGTGVLVILAPTPWRLGDDRYRDKQAMLREAMRVDALIERDRRAFAYWKRKG